MSEAKTPDWADKEARRLMRRFYNGTLSEPMLAAALRSERERCAGIARDEARKHRLRGDPQRMDACQWTERRIRAGDQP